MIRAVRPASSTSSRFCLETNMRILAFLCFLGALLPASIASLLARSAWRFQSSAVELDARVLEIRPHWDSEQVRAVIEVPADVTSAECSVSLKNGPIQPEVVHVSVARGSSPCDARKGSAGRAWVGPGIVACFAVVALGWGVAMLWLDFVVRRLRARRVGA